MWEIKEYKPIALVFYIDGNWNRMALPLDDSKREDFKRVIEASKMVELEWIIINTFDIKEIRPANAITEIEKFYYSQSWKERTFLTQRVRKMSWDNKMWVVEYFNSYPTVEQAIERMKNILEVLNQKED